MVNTINSVVCCNNTFGFDIINIAQGRSPETPAPSLTPTSPLQQSTVAGSNTNEPDQTEGTYYYLKYFKFETRMVDRVFLVDDLPLHEQILINSKTKVYMSLKYNFAEADLEAEVPKTMTLIYHELAGRFKNYPDILPRQPLVSMISCVIHCNTIQRIGGDSM
jgi:hypothetical protein